MTDPLVNVVTINVVIRQFTSAGILLTMINLAMVECVDIEEEIFLTDGPIRGYPKTAYDKRGYTAFEGIPYAKPPLGQLRFKPPVKPDPWTSTLYANQSHTCTQFMPIPLFGDLVGQEDCLYANVYVPHLPSTDQLLDVIVHIHGGAFILGAPNMMAGSRFIMNEDVIYVTFNYRLGIFGFLSTNDEHASGNWGLKDQKLALKWIKDNIHKFGGNPESITLTGQSAGGASVHYHVLSSKSRGLFEKAVLISGTSLNPWALTEDPLSKAQKLAEIFNCPTEQNNKLVECLRHVPYTNLGRAMKKFFKFGNVVPVTPFGPVVEYKANDDAFITKSPWKMLQGNEVANDVPMIISFVKDEGIFPSGYFSMMGQISTIKHKWQEIMQYALDLQDTMAASDWPSVLQQIREYYYPNDDLDAANLKNLTQLWTDRLYYLGIEKAIRLHVKQSKHPVYTYAFEYDSPAFALFPRTKGIAHVEDSQLMFNLLVSPEELTPGDVEMSHMLTGMLKNFAGNLVPLSGWSPMSSGKPEDVDLEYYEIKKGSGNKMATRTELAPREFWDKLPIREEY